MLRYFTTWNTAMILVPHLRKNESRSLIALSSCVALGGGAFLLSNVITEYWFWKGYKINKWKYLFLELFIHQAPIIYLIKNEVPTGNALNSIIPVTIYCSLMSNPYRVLGYKLKNYYGIIMIVVAAPIVNRITTHY